MEGIGLEAVFYLDAPESDEMKKDIEASVNTAVEMALRAGMMTADVSVKIHVRLASDLQGDGKVMLCPTYEYKNTIKIGGKAESGKGESRGQIGLFRDRDGYWHTRTLDEQMSM